MVWQVIFYVVCIALAYYMANNVDSPSPAPPSTDEDFDVPTAEDGKQMPVIFGTVTLQSANIVWYGDLDYVEVYDSTGK